MDLDVDDAALLPHVTAYVIDGLARGVRVLGEVVGLLPARGMLPAALQLEKPWEHLQRELDFPLLCAYPLVGCDEQDAELREHVLALHPHVVTIAG